MYKKIIFFGKTLVRGDYGWFWEKSVKSVKMGSFSQIICSKHPRRDSSEVGRVLGKEKKKRCRKKHLILRKNVRKNTFSVKL